MAGLEKVDKENIEKTRQLLLAQTFSEGSNNRYIKKQAVKQLLGPVIAAREAGMSFEDIAGIFREGGLRLAPATIKSYYFELKAEADLAKEAKRHAETVAKVRSVIEKKDNQAHQDHAEKVALEYAEATRTNRRLFNALDGAGPASPAITSVSGSTGNAPRDSFTQIEPASPAAKNKNAADAAKNQQRSPLANASDQKQASGPLIKDRDKAEGKTSANKLSQPLSDAQLGNTQSAGKGGALTIDEIERMSLATEVRTTITEDLEVRGDRVFLTSGPAFVGTLKKNQIHLLRTVGRIIAITSGKSSKDFITMPSKI